MDGGIIYGRKVLGGDGQTYRLTHFTNLSNKIDNSLLAVRGNNHKYIVVVRYKHGYSKVFG